MTKLNSFHLQFTFIIHVESFDIPPQFILRPDIFPKLVMSTLKADNEDEQIETMEQFYFLIGILIHPIMKIPNTQFHNDQKTKSKEKAIRFSFFHLSD